MKALLPVLACLLLACPSASAQFMPPPQNVGIPSYAGDFIAAAQNNSQWCWAASIEMVLRSYGIKIRQERIVARSYGMDPYGNLPNWAGSLEVITANLNNWDLDELTGRPYVVACQFGFGPPPAPMLLNELAGGRPVILGIRSGMSGGHAVVITGARFYQTPMGPNIVSIVVRDPWPSPQNVATRGRQEYPAAQFAQIIQGYWIVRAQRQ